MENGIYWKSGSSKRPTMMKKTEKKDKEKEEAEDARWKWTNPMKKEWNRETTTTQKKAEHMKHECVRLAYIHTHGVHNG